MGDVQGALDLMLKTIDARFAALQRHFEKADVVQSLQAQATDAQQKLDRKRLDQLVLAQEYVLARCSDWIVFKCAIVLRVPYCCCSTFHYCRSSMFDAYSVVVSAQDMANKCTDLCQRSMEEKLWFSLLDRLLALASKVPKISTPAVTKRKADPVPMGMFVSAWETAS